MNLKNKINRTLVTQFVMLLLTSSFAAKAQVVNWQNLDLKKDSVFGISTERAYNELLKGKKAKTVIVGIVDSGVDTLQEDLKSVLWSDPKTGHHGWNYIDEETGREDITNLIAYGKSLPDSFSVAKLKPQLDGKIKAMKNLVTQLEAAQKIAAGIVQNIGKSDPTIADFKDYKAQNEDEARLITIILRRLGLYPNWKAYQHAEILDMLNKAQYHLAHGLNLEDQEQDTATGNTDVSPDKIGPLNKPNLTAYHGTRVAGIIGAVRSNGIGMDGIADHVQIIMAKELGTIREMRDKCLAQAIRFLVDHGAKVINLSFGKPYTWDKKSVDDAVKYAMKKDVLLIHAAGNAGEDIDKEDHFPSPVYKDNSGVAKAWLEVGASGFKNDSTLAARFSNYGKRDVDVFAPGVNIYCTIPFNQYQNSSGTSMSAPVVTGLAALIREYHPKLTAIQVKDIIVKSVVKSPYLNGMCNSSGVVNAYAALKLAATYKN